MAFSDFKTVSEVLEQFQIRVGDTFTHNITGFNMDNLPALFGALDAVFKAATAAARK